MKGIDSDSYVSSIQFVLDVLERSGNLYEAKELGEKTLKEISKNNSQYAPLLSKVADVYSRLGYYSKSESYLLEALSLMKRTDDPSLNAVNAKINLSALYISQGRYPEAEDILLEACAVLKEENSEQANASLMTALNSLASVQAALAQ